MTWKQFWCKHIWKEISSEFLRDEFLYNIYYDEHHHYNFYATSHKCIKCDKIRIFVEKKIV
jgi:hypothetical protein